MNKKLFLLIAVFGLAAAPSRAEDVTRIEALAGTVEIQKESEGQWVAATVGAEVPEGGSVRTSGDGRAEVRYPDGTKIWLKESTQITIETQRSLLSRLALSFGSIKARVTHMSRNRRMEFKTTTAVAAVRGTEITISQNQDGKFDLNVLFGKVELRIAGIPKTVDVTQGHGYGVDGAGQKGANRLLTRSEEVQGLMKWDPGLEDQKRVERLEENEERRAEIHEFARNEDARKDQLEAIIGRQKEEDLAAGRTFLDVHGNVVRVDQRMLRPAKDELQIVNLVKRSVYKDFDASKPAWAWKYNGGTVPNRLDSLQIRMNFDGNLPEDLTGFPAFFGDHEVEKLQMIYANMTQKQDIFEIAINGVRVGDELKMDELKIARITAGYTATGSGLADTACATNSNACLYGMTDFNNTALFTTYKEGISGNNYDSKSDLIPDGLMIDSFARRWDKFGAGPGAETSIWLATEQYIINNDGAVRKSTDFTDTDGSPFDILRETSMQTILYAKTDGGAGPAPTNTDIAAAAGRNIDVAITPDLGLALLQRIATDLDKLNTN